MPTRRWSITLAPYCRVVPGADAAWWWASDPALAADEPAAWWIVARDRAGQWRCACPAGRRGRACCHALAVADEVAALEERARDEAAR